jgi:CubicO group peptidase (beta-lactamase class C family)
MSRRIDRVLRDAVDTGTVPNLVAMAADRDGVIYEGAVGPRRPNSDDEVTPDSMQRIASMTKIVTTVAALQLHERGRLDLDAPVDRYRPEFADLQVLDGFDGDEPRLRPPTSRATVRHLLTHTSGLSYWFWNADIVAWERATGTPNVQSGSSLIFTAPLVAGPGTRFEYGISTDWLGRVVEAASGQPLDQYFADNILKPLGMTHTGFLMTEAQRANSVPIHVHGEDGSWMAIDLDGAPPPEFFAGGHGLYSTPRDYLAFQRMLLDGGALNGVRLLESATVDAVFDNQIGTLDFPAAIRTADPAASADFQVGPGYKWGLGLMLNTGPRPGQRAVGSGAWAGLFNTHFWIDPASGVTGAIFTQTLPFVEPTVLQVCIDFERALYASMDCPVATTPTRRSGSRVHDRRRGQP